MSDITKRALESSLKTLLSQKPLDKITISDIANECGINRMTFYYHFKDIYDLVEWSLVEEISAVLEGKKSYSTWQDGFLSIFKAVKANQTMVINAYRSLGRDKVETYLHETAYNLMIDVVEEKAEGMRVPHEHKEFIANFYKFALVGLVMEWVRNGLKENPEDIVGSLCIMIHGEIERALEHFKNQSFNQKD